MDEDKKCAKFINDLYVGFSKAHNESLINNLELNYEEYYSVMLSFLTSELISLANHLKMEKTELMKAIHQCYNVIEKNKKGNEK